MKSVMIGLFVGAILSGCGNGGQPTDPSKVHVLQDPNACPVGSTQDTSDSAKSDCRGQIGLMIKDASGNISAGCVQSGEIVVKCNVMPGTCKNGAKTVTRDKIVCADVAPESSGSVAAEPHQ